MFEVYKSIEGRKTYLVSNVPIGLYEEAKKRWKIANSRIEIASCWILDNELYLENPHEKKAVKHWVAFTK